MTDPLDGAVQCAHCGQPGSGERVLVWFCCRGCRQIYQLFHEPDEPARPNVAAACSPKIWRWLAAARHAYPRSLFRADAGV